MNRELLQGLVNTGRALKESVARDPMGRMLPMLLVEGDGQSVVVALAIDKDFWADAILKTRDFNPDAVTFTVDAAFRAYPDGVPEEFDAPTEDPLARHALLVIRVEKGDPKPGFVVAPYSYTDEGRLQWEPVEWNHDNRSVQGDLLLALQAVIA